MLTNRYCRTALVSTILAAGSLACASSGPGGPTPDQTLALARVAGAWNYDQAATAQAANIRGVRPEDHLTQRASDVAMDQMRERGAGGDWADATTPQGSIEVRLRRDGDAFAVERRIRGGGTIRDGFSILESGHLLLTREIVWRQPQRVGLVIFGR